MESDDPYDLAGVVRGAETIMPNHLQVGSDFTVSVKTHRVDIARQTSETFVIASVEGPYSPNPGYGAGNGYYSIYHLGFGIVASGSLGANVQTVRVADGCYDPATGRTSTWFAWEKNGAVYFRRMTGWGTWAGGTYYLASSSSPNVELATLDGDRVALFYVYHSGGQATLRRRLLGCNGSISSSAVVDTVEDPDDIWQIEAAFNPYYGEWRLFYDVREYGGVGPESWLYTAVVDWDGTPYGGYHFVQCQYGTKSSEEEVEGLVEDTDDSGGGDAPRAESDGCQRYYVSYDPSPSNGGHRFLLSKYSRRIMFLRTTGTIAVDRADGAFGHPLTGICNAASCSYQEIAQVDRGLNLAALTHVRFDEYDAACDGPEEIITPDLQWPVPLAMAESGSAAVVVYFEDTGGIDGVGGLFITVLDN